MKTAGRIVLMVAIGIVQGGHNTASAQQASTAGEVASTHQAGKTLLDCFRGIALQPSSEAAIKALKQVHADFTYFPAKGNSGYAQYYTKVGTPDPLLKTDPLADSLRLAHAAGIKVFVTYAMGVDALAARMRPDWAFRRNDGELITIIGTVVCFNSPYRNYALAQIEDLVKNYDLDGLLCDILWWGNMGTEWCCCDYCRQAYRVKFGQAMPEELEWEKMGAAEMKQAIEWRRDTLEETYREIRIKVNAIRPNLPLSFHGLVSWHVGRGNLVSRVNCQRMSDLAYIEVYGDLSFYTAWLRGVSKRPVMGVPPYSGDGFGTVIAEYMGDTFKAGASAVLAQGGRLAAGISYLSDGTLSKNSKALMEPLYREVEEKQPYLEDASSISYAAIVYSEPTKIYYRRENEPYVTKQPLKWLPEIIDYGKDNLEDTSPEPNIKGTFEVLRKLHVPFEFVSELDLTTENLKRFQVVILPNTAILSKPQVEAISQYVKEGGSILATYETTLCNELGKVKDNFDLADVFGLKYITTRKRFDTIFDDGSSLAPGSNFLRHLREFFEADPNMVIPGQNVKLWMPGPFVATQPTAGTVKASLIIQTPGDLVGWGPMPTSRLTDIPAVHFNQFGKGKSVYISTPIFKIHTLPTYPFAPAPVIDRFHGRPYGTPLSRRGWITDLTQELLDELAPRPPIKVEGEPRLETTFFEQKHKNRLIVHLFTSTVDNLSGEASPLKPAKILIRKDVHAPRNVYSAWPKRIELKPLDKGEYLEVAVPETRIHQIVVVER